MSQIVYPIIFFAVIGAVIGVLLTIASKFFFVKTDETVEKITEALPGANCGGCGFSGCAAYAEAVAKGDTAPDLCKPGGKETASKIGEALGIEVKGREREFAYVRCNGNCDATEDKFIYIGTKSCGAVEKFYNGTGKCRMRCHGMGDCIAVCDHGAISIEKGVAVIDKELCIACGKCMRVCPNSLITLVRESQLYMVRCNSPDNAKVTRAICKNGCITCGMCKRKCPSEAIVINGGHAEIDMNKCTGCGTCAQVCPRKCIQFLSESEEATENVINE